MPDALMICPEAPYPVVGGGPMRTASLLEYLAGRYDLDIITFREPGAPDPRPQFPKGSVREVHVLDLPYHSKSTPARALRNLGRMIRNAPPLVDRFGGFQLPIRKRYQVGVIEHFWCAPYVQDLKTHCDRVVLNLHNVESVLLSRCAAAESLAGKIMFQRFAAACRSLEQELLPEFDLLLVTSTADQKLVGGVVYPNTIPLVAQPLVNKRHEVVFSGNLAYYPNTVAVRYFAKNIWPLIQEEDPEVVWRIAGKSPEALVLSNDPSIWISGPMDDAISTLAESRAAVVPLLSGSGTRIKILEAWAAGLPVISTSIGAEGLDATSGVELLIADHPEDFSAAVLSVLKDYSLAERLSRAGRHMYERRFTWPVAWKLLEATGL